jgi:hypothetical protein
VDRRYGMGNPGIHRRFPRISTTIGRTLPSLSTAPSTGPVDLGHASCLALAVMSPRARALVTAGEGGLLAFWEPLERAAPVPARGLGT